MSLLHEECYGMGHQTMLFCVRLLCLLSGWWMVISVQRQDTQPLFKTLKAMLYPIVSLANRTDCSKAAFQHEHLLALCYYVSGSFRISTVIATTTPMSCSHGISQPLIRCLDADGKYPCSLTLPACTLAVASP